ncbi:hypothetical protein V5N11_022160 [Cardamine amara subsp. amara]|uniref:GOST seven transmembrane domain-containing protein n=1 Tax=Cardamine amara subsp. amara TaxID=228776 RepID=A0ABD1C0R8_CARAN
MVNLGLGFWGIAFFLLINAADGSIHEYKNEGFTKIANLRYFHGGYEVLYASEFLDVHASSPLEGKSFIRFDDISFVRSKESANKQNSTQPTSGLVEAILFEQKQKYRVGGSLFKAEDMCCTPKLADAGSCNLGELLITADPNDPQWPKRIPTFFTKGEEEVKMSPEAVAITKTGFYTLYFMTCDPELDATKIRGRTVWKNPYGYLPGDDVPFTTLFASMFWAYVLLALAWFPVFVQHWKHRIQLHSHITLVIVFAMCESAFRYVEFTNVNSTGMRNMSDTFWAVTFSSLRMTLSRLLLLFISSGYGVVKPVVGAMPWRMLLLGVICFVLNEAIGCAEHLGVFSQQGMTFIRLSWSIVEMVFLQWIFRSLWKTLKMLKQVKTNTAKLQFYRMFAIALVFLMSVNITFIQVKFLVLDNPLSEFWWIMPACWYVLAYALLLLICLFWAPSDKPTRYLYIAGMVEEFEKEDTNNNVERDEMSVLEAFLIMFGNLQEERHRNAY